MKILLTTEYFPPFTPGGTVWSIFYMAKALMAAGHEVRIFTPNYGAPAVETYEGVAVVRFPFWVRLKKGPHLAKPWVHVNPLFHFWNAICLFREARRWRPDVIHVQEKHSLVSSWIAGRLLRIPLFLTFRDTGLVCPIATCLMQLPEVPADCGHRKLHEECSEFFNDNYGRKTSWKKALLKAWCHVSFLDIRLKRRLLAAYSGVFGVSRAILDIYRKIIPLPDRQAVLYNLPPGSPGSKGESNAVPIPEGERLSKGPIVLYVGKQSLGKGYPVFQEAARRLQARHPSAVFAVAGAKTSQNFDPAPANVVKVGSVGHDALGLLYERCAFVVLPSTCAEAFSRIPLEAAMAERACVGTRRGGTPEFVRDGETGLLVEPGDPADLARAIDSLLSDPQAAERMGKAARRRLSDDFQSDHWVDELVGLYRDAQ